MASTPFTLEMPIRFSHTDPAGIVYFPNYFDFCNAVIEDWYTKGLGIDYAQMIFKARRSSPIVHAECDFFVPSLMGDRVAFTLTVAKLGRTSLDLGIFGHVAGVLRLQAKIVTVYMDLDSRKPVAIDGDLRARVETYIRACEGWTPPLRPGATP